jgi:hypothetical protein
MICNLWSRPTHAESLMKMVACLKKTMSVLSFIACLAILPGSLFFAGTVNAADTGNLSVIVKGASKKGVTVEVSGGDLSGALEKRTNSGGTVSFKGVTPGTYAVTPRKTGVMFSPEVTSVTIVANQNVRIRTSSSKTAAKVGMAYCVSCHNKVSTDVYADWLTGPHGNFNYVNSSHQEFGYSDFTSTYSYPADYTQFTGFPNDSTFTDELKQPEFAGKSKSYCLGCHGVSSSDNTKVATFPLVRGDGTLDTINSSKQIARPVIGCEACHGSGRKHISSPGKGVTFELPSSVQCGQCHNKNFPEGHLTYHPAGAAGVDNPGIYEAYQASAHTHSLDDASLYNTTTVKKKTVRTLKPLCAKCHSDQGARIYRAVDGDLTTLPPKLAGEADHKDFSPVQCRTCHDAHNPGSLLENASAATGSATARSAEFNTCTNCHQLLDSSDAKITPYHSDHDASITKTHYDNPATSAFEGYNVHRGSDDSCSNCHNPHVAGTTINKQWAESGHGDLTGDPWVHYDWKLANRQACQRCHTPIGFANIVADQANYNPVNNNFSHLTGLQNDTLTCDGCHADSSFKRRTIGAYNGFVMFPSGDKVTLDADSNLCMMCHQGRASKVDIDTKINAGAPPYTSFSNIHYLAAAATFFGTETHGGYEYNGKTYVSRSTFPDHQGKLNSCVTCHLRKESVDEPDHHFKPQASDCAGSTCHAGITRVDDIRPRNAPDYDGDSDTTEGIKGEIDTIRAALYVQIKSYASATIHFPIVYDENASSYWYRDTNGNGTRESGETTAYNKFDAKLLKAAYNYHMSVKEPHTYIHNYKYMLELLYDSLEDLGTTMTPYTRP